MHFHFQSSVFLNPDQQFTLTRLQDSAPGTALNANYSPSTRQTDRWNAVRQTTWGDKYYNSKIDRDRQPDMTRKTTGKIDRQRHTNILFMKCVTLFLQNNLRYKQILSNQFLKQVLLLNFIWFFSPFLHPSLNIVKTNHSPVAFHIVLKRDCRWDSDWLLGLCSVQ